MPTNQSLIPILILSLAILPLFFLQEKFIDAIVVGIDHCSMLSCDFQRHYLPQVEKLVLKENGFVNGWFYPPLLAILLIPFQTLPNPEISWSFFLVGFSVALAYTSHKYSKGVFSLSTVFLLVCISLPVIHCLKWGQISILIALGLIIVLNTQGYFAGFILGFLGAIKLYPLVFVLPFLLQKRHQEFVAMIGSFLLFALAVPLLMMPLEHVLAYYENTWTASQRIQQVAAGLGGQAITPAATRWFEDGSYGERVMFGGLIADIPFIASLLPLGILIPSLWMLHKAPKSPYVPVITLLSLSLVLAPGWEHYFCFLPYCWLVLYSNGSAYSRGILVVLLLMQYLPISHLFGFGVSFFTYAQWGGSTFMMLTMLSLTLYLQLRHIKENGGQIEEDRSNLL